MKRTTKQLLELSERIAKDKRDWISKGLGYHRGTGPIYELTRAGTDRVISKHYDLDTAKKNAKYYFKKTGHNVWIYKFVGYYGIHE